MPKLLDLFCGAGGAAMGYHRAGFDVVGVDINPQPHYPLKFIQADAMTFPLDGFDVIHASPPCQDYSESRYITGPHKSFPRLIGDIRHRLIASGVPWVIENVHGAINEMVHPFILCGTSLRLRVQRHRVFDCSHLVFSAGPCQHRAGDVCIFGGSASIIGSRGTAYLCNSGVIRYRRKSCRLFVAQQAMGIDWMTFHELSESIPPAYTEWIGKQLLSII